jgi:glycosyltransferase involved in cell wall biosynthesis
MLDITPAIHGAAGIARYSRELTLALAALPHALDLSLFEVCPRETRLPTPLASLPCVRRNQTARRWRTDVLVDWLLGRSADSLISHADVFHATDHVLPRLRRTRTVFTVYDLSHLHHPSAHLLLHRSYLQLMLPRFLAAADRIIAISRFTARDVIARMRVPEDRIRVIPLGVSARFRSQPPEEVERVRARYGLPERYILSLATIEPRKNLPLLIEAFLESNLPGVSLVLAGGEGWLAERALGARAREAEGRIALTGFIDESDLPALYSGALLFAFPSLFEGFGLPVLEAMSCGAPVLASNASSLPEVVGDAGILLPPGNVQAWVEALKELACRADRRAELREAGIARAAGFTWDRVARDTLEVYRELHASRP